MTWDRIKAALTARKLNPLLLEDLPAELVPEGGLMDAAVLIPLFERDGELCVLFTRRREDLRRHPGQISFPGGRVDPGDADSLAAALRETHEEVGVHPAAVSILGRLDEYPVITGFRLTPWVGSIPYPYDFKPDPGEVAELLVLPMAALADPAALRIETREYFGKDREIYYYTVGGQTIWGATARILKDLLDIWRP